MKNKFIFLPMILVFFLGVSGFAPAPSSDKSPAKLSMKQSTLIEKIFNSTTGKLIIAKFQKRIEKRQAKLTLKLAKATEKNDLKKINRIKEKMRVNPMKLLTWLLVGGFLIIMIAFLLDTLDEPPTDIIPLVLGLGVLLVAAGLVVLILALTGVWREGR